MKKLVVHIGAQKCGSSSIQQALSNHRVQRSIGINFALLDPRQARNFSHDDATTRRRALRNVDRLLEHTDRDCVVLSHEVLGNLPRSVGALARRAIHRSGFDIVVVVGYTRVQSAYFLAEHKQWSFRSARQLHADVAVVHELGVDATRFTPIERCMIAQASRRPNNPKGRNWYGYYKQLVRQAAATGAEVTVSSNHIPTQHRQYSLVQDFFGRAGIDFEAQVAKSSDQVANQAFSAHLCDAIAFHYADESLDSSWLPGPHERNQWLAFHGGEFSVGFELAALPYTDVVMKSAARSIDCAYRESNMKYCDLMGVDPSFFEVSGDAALARTKFLNVVQEAAAGRSNEAVGDYRNSLLEKLDSLRH